MLKRTVNIATAAFVFVPLTIGWIFGMVIFSFQAGYRSAAVTLHTWSK